MTVVKQVAVCSRRHARSLGRYLDWGRGKALGHGSQNLADERGWAAEMDRTREAYGHNEPGRKGARCTYLYHQVLAFDPDECDLNGGRLSPGECLGYAREYVRARYPDQEAVWVLHRERAPDGTERYAVHLAINRTDLATGRRLDEGPARRAAADRARTVRELDARHGLRQLSRGRNSRAHARQPGAGERSWRSNPAHADRRTDNDLLREAVARRVVEVAGLPGCPNPMRELARRLALDGVGMGLSAGGDLQFSRRDPATGRARRVNGATLGAARSPSGGEVRLDRAGVERALGLGRGREERGRGGREGRPRGRGR